MKKSPKTCGPHDSLTRTARLMRDNDRGSLPVTEGDGSGRLLGMITAHDICIAARFARKPLNEIRVVMR